MQSKMLIVIAAVLVVAVGLSAGYLSSNSGTGEENRLPDPSNNGLGEDLSDVDGVNAFTWDVFDELGKDNIFYSPYGMYTALGMLVNGALKGSDTEKEVLDLLHIDSVDKLNAYIAANSDFGSGFSSYNQILVDTTLLKQDGVDINKDFQTTIDRYYNGEISEADFMNDLAGVKRMIKEWVNQVTNGFIPDYESVATDDTVTDILNVVHFKGDWASKFNEGNSYKADFHNADGSVSAQIFMHQTHSFKYYADSKYRVLELPYLFGDDTKAETAMYIVLPANGKDLNILSEWQSETADYREDLMSSLRTSGKYVQVRLTLPNFEMTTKYDLKDLFGALGLQISFTDDAQYTGILDNQCLKIDGGQHQAKIKVDEYGTEAAAVTEIVMEKAGSLPNMEFVDFCCDIPFVFTISDIDSGIDLFAGYMGFA